jgi:hypothetical protein
VPIAFGTSTTAVGNNVTTSSISVPASTANDDMLLLVINVSESVGVTPTVSGSWTQKIRLDQVASGSDEDHTQILYWRRASSEPGSYTITWDGTYGNYGAAAMLRYTGVIRTGDPFRTTNTAFFDLGAGPKTSATLTGVQSTDMAVHMLGAAKSTWNTDSYDLAGPGGSWVERGEVYMTTASTGKPGHLAVEQLGTGTAPAFTSSGTGATNISWILFGTALIPEPAAAGGGPKIITTAVSRASTW